MQKTEKHSQPFKNKLKALFNLRSAAGITFLVGDLVLAFGGAVNESWAHALSGSLLVAASICLTLSSKNPKWLYGTGGNVIASQALIAWAAEGSGQMTQRLGTIAPILNALLLIRGARHEVKGDGKRFKSKITLSRPFKIFTKPLEVFIKPLEIIDRYPILSGASIELPGAIAISTGAAMSGNTPLAIAAALWVVGLGLIAGSDPNAKRASLKLKYQAKKLGNYLK